MTSQLAPFIANTDWHWFQHLSRAQVGDGAVNEANLWQPHAEEPMADLAPGTPVFFRLKSPRSRIAGHGFYSHFVLLTFGQAWSLFQEGNGYPSMEAFYRRLGEERGVDLLGDTRAVRGRLACTVLRECVFWPEGRWLPWRREEGWRPNIQEWKIEQDEELASRLLEEMRFNSKTVPKDLGEGQFVPEAVDHREVVLASQRKRVGQGAFRSRMLGVYRGRCAITGVDTEIVLDAAHIQPYLGPTSNHVQNGMLLRKDFHALFDAGLVTVTPDHVVRISGELLGERPDRHRYSAFHEQPLRELPEEPNRPSPLALEWHAAKVFRE